MAPAPTASLNTAEEWACRPVVSSIQLLELRRAMVAQSEPSVVMAPSKPRAMSAQRPAATPPAHAALLLQSSKYAVLRLLRRAKRRREAAALLAAALALAAAIGRRSSWGRAELRRWRAHPRRRPHRRAGMWVARRRGRQTRPPARIISPKDSD